ncbi:MAG TPA: hypothetical protein IAB49_03235 [Candidatus Caccenecus avistercoris]|nr:hypothetical protein [Candidatus Caccenecus avistercoris]
MASNWVVDNLNNALNTWNDKLAEIWNLITLSPDQFKDGVIWEVMTNIFNSLQAIALALLVLFFVVGLVRTCSSFTELKKPEHVFKSFIRFAIAKGLVTYGMELLLAIFKICHGVTNTIINSAHFASTNQTFLPLEIITAIENCSFLESIPLWLVTLLGSILVTVLSFIMIMTVYSRFFKIYMYTAISPLAFSTSAGESSDFVCKNFVKVYFSICLEGAIIVLACIIFSLLAGTPPVIDSSVSAVTMVWSYIGELVFNMLILVGTIRLADRVVKEMMGL